MKSAHKFQRGFERPCWRGREGGCEGKRNRASRKAGPEPYWFGRLDEKKFCLLQVLRYRRVVKETSVNCYKSLKSYVNCRFYARTAGIAAGSSGGGGRHTGFDRKAGIQKNALRPLLNPDRFPAIFFARRSLLPVNGGCGPVDKSVAACYTNECWRNGTTERILNGCFSQKCKIAAQKCG